MNTPTRRIASRVRAVFHKLLSKKTIACLLLGALCAGLASPAFANTGAISDVALVESDAWLVMDAATGQLLAAKNPDKQKYPASITKILTLALALEHGSLDDTLTASDIAVWVGPTSHIALQPGEVISVRDAAMATLLASANDAANCLAEYVSGSIEAFAVLMNEKLAELGCTGTHFTNPSGLPDAEHYTTARDMAKITAWALTVPGFRELFAETYYTMAPTNKQPAERSWGTQNAMIVTSAFTAEGAWGGKLGWTEEARHTMVTALTREGRDLILVTMDSQHKYQKYWDGLCILDACAQQLSLLTLEDAAVPAAAVPMYSGDTLLGTVPYDVSEIAIWAPVGIQAQQLRFDWQLPDTLAVGDTTPGTLTVTLPAGTADCLPELTLAMPVPQGDLAEVQTAWATLQVEDDGLTAWQQLADDAAAQRRWRTTGVLVCIPFLLIFLAFCLRWFNLARRNLRKYGTLFRPKKAPVRRTATVVRSVPPHNNTAAQRQALRQSSLRDKNTPFKRR